MNIPAEAQFDKFEHFEFAPGHKLARLEWVHTTQELPVAGDYLEITIHPETRQIVSHDKNDIWTSFWPLFTAIKTKNQRKNQNR